MALDEATTAVLAQIAASSTKPPEEMSVEDRRVSYAARNEMSGHGPQIARVEDVWLPTADGSRFALRLLVPARPIRSVIVYCLEDRNQRAVLDFGVKPVRAVLPPIGRPDGYVHVPCKAATSTLRCIV
jgi:hypothetical protein